MNYNSYRKESLILGIFTLETQIFYQDKPILCFRFDKNFSFEGFLGQEFFLHQKCKIIKKVDTCIRYLVLLSTTLGKLVPKKTERKLKNH